MVSRLAFGSLIQSIKLGASSAASKTLAEFNDTLARRAIAELRAAMAETPRGQLENRGLPGGVATAANEVFFRRQMGHFERHGRHLDVFECLPEFQRLVLCMRSAAAVYLEEHGHSGPVSEELSQGRLVVWASVHGRGSCHPPHVHSDSAVSGVYYAACPGGGVTTPIVFEDPRGKTPFDHMVRIENELRYGIKSEGGSAPPFDGVYEHFPTEGELVTFPPWMVHSVPATGVKEEEEEWRVSLSYNLLGGWDKTATLGQVTLPPTAAETKKNR